jgi:hypothetical protein
MEYSKVDRWKELFGIEPSRVALPDLRRKVAARVRDLCNEVNQRLDRRGIVYGLRDLEQMAQLLESHHWLSEE